MKADVNIRLLIAGEADANRTACDALLTIDNGIALVGRTLDIARVPEKLRLLRPDVILIHASPCDLALAAIGDVLASDDQARLLVVTPTFNVDQAAQTLERGARGIIAAPDFQAQGLRAIRAVYAGEIWGSRALLSRIVNSSIKHSASMHAREKNGLSLTERESDVIKLLRSGASNKEIAAQLSISDKTVKTHLQNIFSKLHVHRRQQIVPALTA